MKNTILKFRLKVILKALATTMVIILLMTALIVASYHILGIVPTLCIIGIYSVLAFWMNYELGRSILVDEYYNPITKTKADFNSADNRRDDAHHTGKEPEKQVTDPDYDVVQVYEPEYIV